MKLSPLGDRIIVKALETEENQSRIVLPGSQEKSEGHVIAVGSGVLDNGSLTGSKSRGQGALFQMAYGN